MTDTAPDAPVAAPCPIVRVLAPTDVSPAGTHVRITADAAQCAAIAALADVPAVDALSAELVVKPWSGTGFAVDGRVRARLRQACVVTLEPVETTVDEVVAVKLVPPQDMVKYVEEPDENGDIDLDAVADLPDPMENGVIDVGAIVVEHFMVGIEPYPRKEGALFDAAAVGAEAGPEVVSPFAALARLGKE